MPKAEKVQIKDSVIEKIAQTYLSDTIEDDYSLKYKKLRRSVHVVTYSALVILAAFMAAFIISAQRVNISITLNQLDKKVPLESAEKILLKQYNSKINLIKKPTILSANIFSNKAVLTLNFKRPVDLRNGVFLIKAKALKEPNRLRLVVRDEAYRSNSRVQEPVVIVKDNGFNDIVLGPSGSDAKVNMDKVQQVRLELEPVLENSRTKAAISIKELSFLTQTRRD